MLTFLEQYWDRIISLVLMPALAWFFTKRHFQHRELKKLDQENQLTSSDIIHRNLEIYQKMLDDVESRYEEKLKKRDDEYKTLEKELEEVKRRLKDCEQKIK